jgi:hypothetical protein
MFGVLAFQRPAQAQALWSDDPFDNLDPGGGATTLTVNLPNVAAYDTPVYMATSTTGPTASVPSAVIVPAGQSSADFTLTYGAQTSDWDSVTVNFSSNNGNDTGSTSIGYASSWGFNPPTW